MGEMNKFDFRIWSDIDQCFLEGVDKYHFLDLKFQEGDPGFAPAIDYCLERYTVQQWTGLKDKTGFKIFEGDIITFDGKWDEDGKVLPPDHAPYEIVRIGACLVAYLIQEPNYSSFHKHNEIIHLPYTDNQVVGNIFENPELMKNE